VGSRKPKFVLGLDPGLEGAGVLLGSLGLVMYTFKISECVYKLKHRKMYDTEALFLKFVEASEMAKRAGAKLVIVIENGYRFPKLTFGIGVLWALAHRCEPEKVVLIAPRTWQRTAGIKKADKKVSILQAKKLLNLDTLDHNTAEAALIAHYQHKIERGA